MPVVYYFYSHPGDAVAKTAHFYPILLGEEPGMVLREAVALLTRADVARLVLPDDYRHHCTWIEKAKAIALHLGLKVQPLTHYRNERAAVAASQANTPATAAATPTNEAVAVAG